MSQTILVTVLGLAVLALVTLYVGNERVKESRIVNKIIIGVFLGGFVAVYAWTSYRDTSSVRDTIIVVVLCIIGIGISLLVNMFVGQSPYAIWMTPVYAGVMFVLGIETLKRIGAISDQVYRTNSSLFWLILYMILVPAMTYIKKKYKGKVVHLLGAYVATIVICYLVIHLYAIDWRYLL